MTRRLAIWSGLGGTSLLALSVVYSQGGSSPPATPPTEARPDAVAAEPPGRPAPPPVAIDEVRALYVNAWAWGSERLWDLAKLAQETEINALVLDVKDDTGELAYRSGVPLALSIGATSSRVREPKGRLDSLRALGIYPIARIVVAKDPLLARQKSAWAVRDSRGGLWRDRLDFTWVDAYHDSVWIYAADIAAEAVSLGFLEVQFDYVRFPDEPQRLLQYAVFSARREGESRRNGVRRNLELLRDRVKTLGVPFTIDVFGLTTSATDDMGIGQVWEDLVGAADVVLPMVYPSHYRRGSYGIRHPNSEPYRLVYQAVGEALQRTQLSGAQARIRPFLQAFTLGRPRYTAREIREQIRAVEEHGLKSWVLWNPRSVYRRDALLPEKPRDLDAGSAPAPPLH